MIDLKEVKTLILNCNPILLGSFTVKNNIMLVYKDGDLLVKTINDSGKFTVCHYDENTRTIKFKEVI